jgi:hypothetical protein
VSQIVNATNALEAARAVKAGSHRDDPGPSTVRRSLTLGGLAKALARAQAELKNPPKESVNPHFKSRYADLATVRDVVVPVLAKHGLAVMQLPCELDDHPALTTLLVHGESGEWVETTIRLRPGKLDPQGVGSALTYLRRYSLQSVAGVAADDDDDGNQGSVAHSPPGRQTQQPARDNLQLRARYCQDYAMADTPEKWRPIGPRVTHDADQGRLSDADLAAIRAAAAESPGRPQKATA